MTQPSRGMGDEVLKKNSPWPKKRTKFKALPLMELMQTYSRIAKKPCMYISWWDGDDEFSISELFKAAPYLETAFREQQVGRDGKGHHNATQLIGDGYGVLVFDTEKEMKRHYDMTVGDDGPTKLNKHKGKVRVYACTCVNGQTRNENT